ncbi:MAG: hypothetical protein HC809_04895 [Gammaproteobacteria bacterium]|nr:hypothetical protein [Gammaproteobacteria bacterium]
MIDPANTPEDDRLRRLYQAERPEPASELDAAILAAARAAVANAPPRRKWRYPVGVGAAASALLAVLLLQPTDELSTQPAAPEAVAQTSDAPREMLAPSAEAIGREAMQRAEREIADSAPSHGAAPAMKVAEPAMADAMTTSDTLSCAASATTLERDGLKLCITDGFIEARDFAAGCAEPVHLQRSVSGAVGVARDADATLITIDDKPFWRLQCVAGNWQIDALR